jgi:hypothetical protein
MTDDVYAPGTGEVIADPDPAAVIVRALRQTWVWVAMLALFALLGTLFLFGGGVSMLVLGNSIALPAEADPFGIGRWIGALYIVFGFFSIVPLVLLSRFAFAAMRVTENDGLASAARAVRRSRDLWVGYGVLTLLLMLAYCGGAVALVIGMAATMS